MTEPANQVTPYLSVVAASRNDDHGGDPLVRTQIFISNFARQCEQHRLPAELILVDWNPVENRPGLAGMLQLPPEAAYCQARVITVPAELHRRLKYSEQLQFFQMIAKNAGIRRARGQFILATNIDIIFSEELIRYLAAQRLDPKKTYRVDRYDIAHGLPATHLPAQVLDYAWSHPVRSNYRTGPKQLVDYLYGEEQFVRECRNDPAACPAVEGVIVASDGEAWSVNPPPDAPFANLHTNACGDFTLLSREGWNAITGYAEFEAFSFNIDSFSFVTAHYAGYREVALLPPLVCFHIEHSFGSGWTPEGERKLFARLQEKKILNPDWPVLHPLIEEMRRGDLPLAVNTPSWGLAEFSLPEESLRPGAFGSTLPHPQPFTVPAGRLVGALRAEFDLDRATLWNERRNTPTQLIEQLQTQLQVLDRDRAERLKAIHRYQAKLQSAYEDHERNVAYLQALEKDSAARLASIEFYQGKLQKAYEDHEHNLKYIQQLHAEIAAHVKVAAEREATIAQLNEQLRGALERRPASP
jgi:hypothetical protein